jgi:tetratricopeptide (TPR) repeat protein
VRNKTRTRNSHIVRRISYAIEQLEAAKDKPWLDNKNLNDFLKSCGHQARKLDRRDLGYLFFDLARRLSPKDTFSAIDAAIELRDSGKVRAALQRLDKILLADPRNSLALHEKGVCFYVRGDAPKAKEFFRKVVELNPSHNFAWRNLLNTSIATQQYDESAALIGRLRDTGKLGGNTLDIFEQLIVFLKSHGPEISNITDQNDLHVTRSNNFQERAANVVAKIGTAVAERKPFSLIRLGDGEGALLARSTYPDAEQFDKLLTTNRTDFLMRWFGTHAGEPTKSIETLTRDLRTAIDDADIVGIPEGGWWRRELRLASTRGLPSLGAVLLHARTLSADRLCHHEINRLLDRNGNLDTVLSGHKRPIAVIGPHPGIDTYVRERFLVPDVRAIRIPARQADLASLPYGRDERCHYPDVFAEVCDAIAELPDNSICLVGAGPLGKIYCARAKAHGHIAIDLGSVFDTWIGVSPRFYV